MFKRSEAGFTLIEITIVLAISASLITIVFAGQASVRETSQFSSAVEQLVSTFNSINNEAGTTVSNSASAGTGTSIFYGKLVQLNNAAGSNTSLTVSDITAATTDNHNVVTGLNLPPTADYTVNFPYGVKFLGAVVGGTLVGANTSETLLYHPLTQSNQLYVYDLYNSVTNPITSMPMVGESSSQAYSLSNNTPGQIHTITLRFSDPKGRTAELTIDGLHGGAVTRIYN